MTEKFRNRYRIASARAAWWSYGWAGAYFITICTKNRRHFFGKITGGIGPGMASGMASGMAPGMAPGSVPGSVPGRDKACLVSTTTPVGELAQRFWYEIPHHAQSVELGAFQVMPNHIHGIIILTGNANTGGVNGGTVVNNGPGMGTKMGMKSKYHPRFQNQGKNTVSSIIGGYKSAVTRHAHRLGFAFFDWQFSFHDHIIRNDQEYQRINDYIENNPQKWLEDRFFSSHKH